MAKQISLRPYKGKLYVAKTRKQYYEAHKAIYNEEPDVLNKTHGGRFVYGNSKGMGAYLVYAKSKSTLVHELSHVVLHLFDTCGIDPRSNDEPFCYLVQQLYEDATNG